MSAFNLIRDPWIPIVTSKSRRRTIGPADLAAGHAEDPVLDIDWPRADFRAAQIECLIGLLTTACQPRGNSAWHKWWKAPPGPDELAEILKPFELAFDLDGEGPRFLQDRGDLGAESVPIGGLLIEQPGVNTEKNNADLFVKRGQVRILARSTAAIALYTLQTFAPSGGAGHRTGLRGGGPLTTLAKPADRPTLWRLIWLNVVTGLYDPIDDGEPLDAPGKTFPWLAPLRGSDKGGVTTTQHDIHPAQCFWGMPRRIALHFEANPAGLACDITGTIEPVIVRAYRTRPYGVNYQAVSHPLTPTYRVKVGTEPLPVHPQPGGIAYRHWLSLVQQSELRSPAKTILGARARSNDHNTRQPRMLLFGYDMDNMKARGFIEAEMPLLFASDAGQTPQRRQDKLERLAQILVDGAVETISLTISQIKAAKLRGGSDLDIIREGFFAATESAFFETLQAGLAAIEAEPDGATESGLIVDRAKAWLDSVLSPRAIKTFDAHVQADAVVAIADLNAMQRVAAARSILKAALLGYGPAGKRLFTALGMGAPTKSRPKQARKAAAP